MARHAHLITIIGHAHAPADFGKAFAIGITLNTAFVIIETVCGFYANSMALVADAGHNLSDVLGLIVAWAGAMMARSSATPRFTYGLKKASILVRADQRLVPADRGRRHRCRSDPPAVPPAPTTDGEYVIVVASIGIVVNGLTALLFARGRRHDINIQGAYLHMASDALVSLAVVFPGS